MIKKGTDPAYLRDGEYVEITEFGSVMRIWKDCIAVELYRDGGPYHLSEAMGFDFSIDIEELKKLISEL